MSGVFLPQQLVTKRRDVSRRSARDVIPHAREREESVADVGRQTGGAASIGRPHLVTPRGVPAHSEAGEGRVGCSLAAGDG